MSLTHVFLPPPRDVAGELRRENESLKAQIRELNIALTREQERGITAEAGAERLRTVLTPLYQALQLVFGDLDAMGIEGAAQTTQASAPTPKHKAVWDSWKEKLGGKAAAAIDALLVHGEMTHTQLKIHIRCGQQTVYDTVHRLNKAGIINKNGGKVSLKEL